MPDPHQRKVFQQQRRRCEEPSDIRYFKSAQTKLLWREMKISCNQGLQCMLRLDTLKSLATTQKCQHFKGA